MELQQQRIEAGRVKSAEYWAQYAATPLQTALRPGGVLAPKLSATAVITSDTAVAMGAAGPRSASADQRSLLQRSVIDVPNLSTWRPLDAQHTYRPSSAGVATQLELSAAWDWAAHMGVSPPEPEPEQYFELELQLPELEPAAEPDTEPEPTVFGATWLKSGDGPGGFTLQDLSQRLPPRADNKRWIDVRSVAPLSI
jgi:hypothetical protein